MKFLLSLTVLTLAGGASATPQQAQLEGQSFTDHFAQFKKKFGKVYHSAEEEFQRFKNFVYNMEMALKLRMTEGGTASYGHMSPLADMSAEEFRKLNNLAITPQEIAKHEKKAAKHLTLRAAPTSALPSAFDWRDKGAVTDVKDQKQCGSCWAFGTVASIEGSNFLTNGELLSLSEQELVDCSTSDNGCNGGLPSRAYEDLIDTNSGVELEVAYPYAGVDEACSAKKSLEKVFLSGWVPVSKDEDDIAHSLMQYGPLAIALNAGPMQMYTGGISDPWFCSPSGIDHAVTLTGFGEEEGKPYWSIKNSWGEGWGETGYYRLIRGKGKCGMNLMVTAAQAAKKETKSDVYV